MRKIVYLLILFWCFSFHGFSQNNIKFDTMKRLSKESYYQILEENEGRYSALLTKNPISKRRMYFIGFNYQEDIISCNDTEEEIFLFPNSDALFLTLEKKAILELDTPLLKHRHLMYRLDSIKGDLIAELFEKLNIQNNTSLNALNLSDFDVKLKKYGYKNAYKDLYLHLILFCGELINETSNKQYEVNFKSSSNFPITFEPYYKEVNGESLYFPINVELSRMLNNYDTDEDYRIYEKEGRAIRSIMELSGSFERLKKKISVKKDKN